MKHSTGKQTRYESERIAAMLRLGCLPCAMLAIPFAEAECHHIVEGNRLGHWYTLPICPGHHRGVWTPEQVELIPPDVRVSIADGSKVFEEVYGTQRAMWVRLQARLKLPAVWPSSKILPRRGYVESAERVVSPTLGEANPAPIPGPLPDLGDRARTEQPEATTAGGLAR